RALPGTRRGDWGGDLPPKDRRGHHRRLPDRDAAVTERLCEMVEEADGRAIRGAQQKSNRRNPRQERVHSNGNEVMTVSNEYDFIGIGGSLAGQVAAAVATSFRASDAGEPPAASPRRRCQKRRLTPVRLSSRLMSCGSRRWHQAVRLPTPASTIISSR